MVTETALEMQIRADGLHNNSYPYLALHSSLPPPSWVVGGVGIYVPSPKIWIKFYRLSYCQAELFIYIFSFV